MDSRYREPCPWGGLAAFAFGRGIANLFIWLGILSPIWILIGGVVFFFVWRSRKARAKVKKGVEE